MREPKESPWKLSEPASFRSWFRRSMTPMGYDKALKRKEKLAVAYFFMSFLTFNAVLWEYSKRKEISPSVVPENPIMQDYLAVSPAEDNREAYILTYENFSFKKAEYVNQKEVEQKRREE